MTVGVNFIGGYSAVVSKGMTKSDELLIRSIPTGTCIRQSLYAVLLMLVQQRLVLTWMQ